MKKENTDFQKTDGEQIITEIIEEQVSSIDIQGYDRKDNEKQTIDIALWADKSSEDILNKLFRVFQSELECVSMFMGLEDVFSSTSRLLFVNFHNQYIDKEDLGTSIEDEIQRLEQFKFHNTPSLSEESAEKKDEISELSIEDIKKLFITLRERRIKIYKKLLQDFKENKEKYLEYMKNQDYSYF